MDLYAFELMWNCTFVYVVNSYALKDLCVSEGS